MPGNEVANLLEDAVMSGGWRFCCFHTRHVAVNEKSIQPFFRFSVGWLWIEYDEMDAPRSKPILDEIDTALAKHYGFTPEELDFILNYDIKYRLGRDTEGEEE